MRSKVIKMGKRDNAESQVLVMHAADPSSIPAHPKCPQGTTSSDP